MGCSYQTSGPRLIPDLRQLGRTCSSKTMKSRMETGSTGFSRVSASRLDSPAGSAWSASASRCRASPSSPKYGSSRDSVRASSATPSGRTTPSRGPCSVCALTNRTLPQSVSAGQSVSVWAARFRDGLPRSPSRDPGAVADQVRDGDRGHQAGAEEGVLHPAAVAQDLQSDDARFQEVDANERAD